MLSELHTVSIIGLILMGGCLVLYLLPRLILLLIQNVATGHIQVNSETGDI